MTSDLLGDATGPVDLLPVATAVGGSDADLLTLHPGKQDTTVRATTAVPPSRVLS